MKVSRRGFLALCASSSVAIALGPSASAGKREGALALPTSATNVVWLHGSGCTGCSVSFLNRISETAPADAADVLLNVVQLRYHPTLMGAYGATAANAAEEVYQSSPYLLLVEGGVPTLFNGGTCWAWTLNGREYTFLEVVKRYAGRAAGIVSIGNCAGWGGVSAAAPNPTKVVGVNQATGKPVINIAGCPPHPDWIVWTLAQILSGASMRLDKFGRPEALFKGSVHDKCPRKGVGETNTYGVDNRCLKKVGCRGPRTRGGCPVHKWNGGANWCVDANAPCIGCTEPDFPQAGLMLGREA